MRRTWENMGVAMGEHEADMGEHEADMGEHEADMGEHEADMGEHEADMRVNMRWRGQRQAYEFKRNSRLEQHRERERELSAPPS